jgi:prepilin-type N-terminal cleavage/methylation domain-containing protein
MRRRRHLSAGFTLTEMMVVVTIVGILVTMAIVYMRGRVRPMDVANRVGDLVREASRRAVALGPVRADVAVVMGKARTQISATAENRTVPGTAPPITFTTVTFTLWRLQEDPPAVPPGPCPVYPCWVPIDQYITDSNVDVESWAPFVVDHTSGLRTSNWAPWVFPFPGLPNPPPAPPLQCRPDGTCDPYSFFFKAVLPGPSCDPQVQVTVPLTEQCAKLAVMPLGAAITTRADWN